MGRFDVSILPRAEGDVQHIFSWLEESSEQGAANWYVSFAEMISWLKQNADVCAEAIEAKDLERPLKQCLFKTQKGRMYRAVFLIDGMRVFVLRLRGPGQPNLQRDEL